MTPRQFRRLKPAHNPNEPIPPEIAARMTKPKPREEMCQVVLAERDGSFLAIGPKADRPFLEPIVEAINGQRALGKLKTFGEAFLVSLD